MSFDTEGEPWYITIIVNAAFSPLYRAPSLAALPSEAIARLERASEEKHFRRKQIIFFAEQRSDYVFLLGSGRVKLTRASSGGREVTISLVDPYGIFGECGLFDSLTVYACTAETLEDCTVIALRRVDVEAILDANPGFLREMLRAQIQRRHEAETRVAELVFYDVSTRLAHLLAAFSMKYGRAGREGILLRLKLTHQELANLIGSTRETTTLILNDFRRQGLIDFSGRRIIVLDQDKLSQLESLPPSSIDTLRK